MKDTGGPAFPQIERNPLTIVTEDKVEVIGTGMTLRDWFAGQALTGLFQDEQVKETRQEQIAVTAMICYEMADAMIAERSK